MTFFRVDQIIFLLARGAILLPYASSREAAMFVKDQKDRLQEPTILEPYNVSARHHLSVVETIHSVTL